MNALNGNSNILDEQSVYKPSSRMMKSPLDESSGDESKATCMQWYRLGRMKSRLSHSLAICGNPQQDLGDFSEAGPSNDLVCVAPPVSKGIILYRGIYDGSLSDQQKIGELLCYQGNRRCCTVIPQKRVDLSQWIGFPKGQTLFPFEISDEIPESENIRNINLLLYADIKKSTGIDEIHTLQIEHLGIPIAWRVDSKMALIVRTDIQLFTSLCSAFMSKTIAINCNLQLLRIETVSLSGKVYEYRSKDLSSNMQWIRFSTPKQWTAHISQLRSLCSHVKHSVARHRDDSSKHNIKKSAYSKKLEKTRPSKKEISDIDYTKSVISAAFISNEPDLDLHKFNITENLPIEIKKQENINSVQLVEISDDIKHSPIENNCKPSNEEKTEDPTIKADTIKSKSKQFLKPQKKTSKSDSTNDSKLTSHSQSKSPERSDIKSGKNIFKYRKNSEKKVEKSEKKNEKSLLSFKRTPKVEKETTKEDVRCAINITENPIDHITNGVVSIQIDDTDISPAENSTVSGEAIIPSKSLDTNRESINVQSKHSPSSSVNDSAVNNQTKPPNVLIYADSVAARESVSSLLNSILHKDKYTVYSLSPTSMWWGSKATLLVVCGAVADHLGPSMLDYLLTGGKMLCLCSDFINTVLPTYTTAEVRERELVRFSYDRWHRVLMIHHIFCYQPSPGRKLFSKESSEEVSPNSTRCVTPSIVEVKDSSGSSHKLEVRILGAEDTWHTPSLILASVPNSTGLAVFSQVHLELEPSQYESDDAIYPALCESNAARIDIIRHLLETHLGLQCAESTADPVYLPAFFLGSHELKLALLSRLASDISENIFNTNKLKLQFCGKGVEPSPATSIFLPILVHSCPDKFSTVDYFDTLKTKHIGRLLLYAGVMSSSMDVFSGVQLEHGMAVTARRQTQGSGRGGNNWLSPEGCAMFSIQLHIPLNSQLGQRASLIQILAAVAVVSAIRSLPGYAAIDIGVKWPNDIYAKKRIKIGGIISNSSINTDTVICNVGIGINLSNSDPTTCLNDLIKEFNESSSAKLSYLSLERFLALVFNEFEEMYDIIQGGDMNFLYSKYYEYWLHRNVEVNILSANGASQKATVLGIDDYGYLQVRSREKIFSVHPDGNSFDMLVGLIAPKLR